jgi:hypothetical protein
MTFNRLNHLASKPKYRLISNWGVDWTASKSNPFNLQMPWESSSLNLISGSALIIGMKIIQTSSEHYTTGIISNIFSSFGHISHFRCTLIMNRWAL